jgi:hypothetical protein
MRLAGSYWLPARRSAETPGRGGNELARYCGTARGSGFDRGGRLPVYGNRTPEGTRRGSGNKPRNRGCVGVRKTKDFRTLIVH